MVTRRAMLRKMVAGGAAVAAGAVALKTGVAGAQEFGAAATAYYRTTDYVNFRRGPGTRYQVRKVLGPGEQVRYLGETRNGYIKTIHNGMGGWVHFDYVTAVGTDNPGNGDIIGDMVTTDVVNLRAGASTGHQVLRVLKAGTVVEASDIVSAGFRWVIHEGLEGWIYDDYLRTADGPLGGIATTTSALNLRAEPSTSSKVLVVIPKGGKVFFGDQIANGYRNVTYNGVNGWALNEYLAI